MTGACGIRQHSSKGTTVSFAEAALEYRGFWANFADLFWWFLTILIIFTYILVVFSIVGDLFRDKQTKGFVKAIWIIALIAFPFITALIYLIVRGGGMSKRQAEAVAEVKAAQDAYIQQVAGISPAEEIAKAKALLDAGTITAAEYESLKAKALAG